MQHFRATEEAAREATEEAAAREATEEAEARATEVARATEEAREAGESGEDKLDDQSKYGTWLTTPQLSTVYDYEESNELHDGHRPI